MNNHSHFSFLQSHQKRPIKCELLLIKIIYVLNPLVYRISLSLWKNYGIAFYVLIFNQNEFIFCVSENETSYIHWDSLDTKIIWENIFVGNSVIFINIFL